MTEPMPGHDDRYSGNAIPTADSTSSSGPRGKIVLAWIAILLVTAGVTVLQNWRKVNASADQARSAGQLVILELQLRLWIGWGPLLENVMPDPKARDELRRNSISQIAAFNRGGLEQRFSSIIALGDVEDPHAAKRELATLRELIEEHRLELSENERAVLEILTDLYTDYTDGRFDAPMVGPDGRKLVESSLGWLGELALNPADPNRPDSPQRLKLLAEARQTAIGVLFLILFLLVAFVVGTFGLLVMAFCAIRGRKLSRLGPYVPHHGVYAETFAIWMPCYLGLAIAVPKLLAGRLTTPYPEIVAMTASLVVLAWPVLRGISWKQVRQDVGLTFGSQPFLEPTLGFVSYLHCFPFLLGGVGYMTLLAPLLRWQTASPTEPFRSDPSMAHPLIAQLRQATSADILQFFLLMAIAAPVMEEIVFRGLLYRHLRDLSRSMRLSIAFSMLIVSVLFAMVHPQGLMAVPLLASLACGFALAREWRGTLIPSIIAHGLNNTLILFVITWCLTRM